MEIDLESLKYNIDNKLIRSKIYNLCTITWNKERDRKHSKGKHQLYAEIKTKNSFEKYLDIDNMNIRKAITKMRISSHKFPIETGRYEGKERENRICPLCCNDIGDEKHYIFECENKTITETREKFMPIIFSKSPQLKRLGIQEKLKYMLLCNDDSLLKDIGILFLKIQKDFDDIF